MCTDSCQFPCFLSASTSPETELIRMCMSKIFITRPPSWALVSGVMIYSLYALLPSPLFLMRLLDSETRLKLSLARSRYSHLNAQFQRIARRDKKAFLSNQCKEIEENNRMGRLEITSRKLEIPREHFMQRWAQ